MTVNSPSNPPKMAKQSTQLAESGIDELLDCTCLKHHFTDLTSTELAVANYFVSGQSYEEIAARRQVSVETIKTQIASLLSKTGMKNRHQLLLQVVSLNFNGVRRHTNHYLGGYKGGLNKIPVPADYKVIHLDEFAPALFFYSHFLVETERCCKRQVSL